MSASSYVHIQIDNIKRETDKAFLLVLMDGEEVWMPKSQIADPEEYEVGDADFTLSITEFICAEKGLEPEE